MKPSSRLLASAFAVGISLSLGCSTKPQNIRIDPQLQVTRASVGQGKTVWLEVKDARTRKMLGVVGDLDTKYVHVSSDDDPSSVLYQSVSAGLRELGFAVQPTPTEDQRGLSVELRQIDYEALRKGLTFDTRAMVAFAAVAQSASERYERLYSAGMTRAAPFPPSAADNQRAVNALVATSLHDMLADDQLIGVLAR